MHPIVLFFVACSVTIVGLAVVPPAFLVWNDRRRQENPPPLPKGLGILGRVVFVFMTLVVIVGVATIFLVERWVADQERACKDSGGSSYSVMNGCS